MTAAVLNGGKQQAQIAIDSEDTPKRIGNPLMRGLKPEMYKSPYSLDFAGGMASDQFCLEKCASTIVQALEFKTEKEWIDFAKQTWRWIGQAEERRREAVVQDLLARASEDPKVLELLKEKLQ